MFNLKFLTQSLLSIFLLMKISYGSYYEKENEDVNQSNLNICISDELSYDDTKNLDQKELRNYLKQVVLPKISPSNKKQFKFDTIYFSLPNDISNYIQHRNVLEIGSGPCASVRCFSKAKKIVIVEPSIEALSLAFDKEWTHERDLHNKGKLEAFKKYSQSMDLDATWIDMINFSNPELNEWISDQVDIQVGKMQDLPEKFNQFFDVIAYKDYNVPQQEAERFFERLAQLLNPEGYVILQFWADEYKDRVKYDSIDIYMKQLFSNIEFKIDKKGHIEETPSGFIKVRNDVRFVILSKPKV